MYNSVSSVGHNVTRRYVELHPDQKISFNDVSIKPGDLRTHTVGDSSSLLVYGGYKLKDCYYC